MRRAKLNFVKVERPNGKIVYVLDDWSRVASFSNLPKEYVKSGPAFWQSDSDKTLFVKVDDETNILFQGSVLEPDEFRKLISIFKKAGSRLATIHRSKRFEVTI